MGEALKLNELQRKRLHQITFVATFGGLLFGYDTGVINGAFDSLKANMGLTPDTEGFIMSFLLAGAALGSIFGGKMSDCFGRRKYLLSLSWIFLFGAIASAVSPNIQILLLSRFILGFAVGGASVTAPTFISEVAPTENRGKLTGLNEVAIVIGQLAAFAVNAFIGVMWGHLEDVWRYMLCIQAVPAIGLLVGMLYAPESPRWLIMKGRKEEAFNILKQIRPEARAQQEYEQIVKLTEEEKKANLTYNQTFKNIIKHSWILKIVIVGIIWAAAQQTTGVNAVMYYGTEILKYAGFSQKEALVCNILNGVFSVGGMLLGVTFLVDRFKRKTIVIAGFFLMASMHLSIALVDMFMLNTPEMVYVKGIIIWLLAAIFVGIMQGTMGFITWVILAELFPLRVRGFAMGVSVFAMWIMNATVSYLFPLFMKLYGLKFVFLLFAIINYLVIIFVIKCLPETSGKSLEQLEEELSLN